MNGRIAICIISTTGFGVRQASFSKAFLMVMGILAAGGVAMAVIGFEACLALNGDRAQLRQLEQVIGNQQGTIDRQHRRIQGFAGELDRFHRSLVALEQLESMVRVMADLEDDPAGGSCFGVGGPAPTDRPGKASLPARCDPSEHGLESRAGHLARIARIRTRGMSSLVSLLAEKAGRLAATPSIRPAPGWKTSGFGYRTSPFTGRREFHHALDIANRAGTPIRAAADGVVVKSGNGRFRGNRIAVDHGHGMVTVYAHASKLLKKRGERVHRGDTIALMGSTGRSTGPHLHYEVLLNGVPVNPEKYILN